MTRIEFGKLVDRGAVLLGGGVEHGAGERECPEKWMLERFDEIAVWQSEFKDAGAAIIRCPSAGANRYKLKKFGLSSETAEINKELMRSCRKSLGDNAVIFGSCSSTGIAVEPFGKLGFEDAVSCFAEQGRALAECGADGFFVDMGDIQEARAALIALRDFCCLPVVAVMELDERGLTHGGTDPLSALVTLQALGADAVGFSSSDSQLSLSLIIKKLKPHATVPLAAFYCVGEKTPDDFGAVGAELVSSGANLLGGNGNVSSLHIKALCEYVSGVCTQLPLINSISALSSAKRTVFPGKNNPFAVVGERINPTGKKLLQASLREGSLDLVRQFAFEQEQRRASVLDVNMGLSGIDEMAMMLRAVNLLSDISPLPLCIDTTRPEVVEAALRLYPGRALVNSVSGERERIEHTLPIAAKYGAMFIVLPLTDDGIPATVNERIKVIETIMAAAEPLGVTVDDIVVDGLVMTVSSDPGAAIDTLDLVQWCSDTLHSNTICGLSNVSFGMPDRQWINGAFLGMAMGRGLTMAIANPSSDGIMATVQAYNTLCGYDSEMIVNQGRFTKI